MKTTETELALIEKVKTQYNVPLQSGDAINLFVDGLCENPGAMHIGLYATQTNRCLFAEHLAVGHGTCNIAEYVAVITGLKLLQGVYPCPNVSITVASDSQLVVNQVNGKWNVSNDLTPYHSFLRRMQRSYPFELRKIPRQENTIADGLAQRYIQKNSGRCMSIDQGRFHVSKAVPPVIKSADAYKALTSHEFRDYLAQHGLQNEMTEVIRLANEGDADEALELVREVRDKAANLLRSAPKTNQIVSQWVVNAHALMEKALGLMEVAIKREDSIDLQYLFEELSGAETSTSEFWRPDDISTHDSRERLDVENDENLEDDEFAD